MKTIPWAYYEKITISDQSRTQDPLNTVGNVCARTANELLVAFRQLGSRSSELSLPVYVGHGEACIFIERI